MSEEFLNIDNFEVGFREILEREINALSGSLTAGFNLQLNEMLIGKGVHIPRRIGPVIQAADSLKKIGAPPEEVGFILGQQWGKAVLLDFIEVGIRSLVETSGDTNTIIWSEGNMCEDALPSPGGDIALLIMHSKQYFDLGRPINGSSITDVGGVCIHQVEGYVPVMVSDSVHLMEDGEFNCIGLDAECVKIFCDAKSSFSTEEVMKPPYDDPDGEDKLHIRYQGAYDFYVNVKGFSGVTDLSDGIIDWTETGTSGHIILKTS